MATDFNFVLLNNASNGFYSSMDTETNTISNDTNEVSLLTASNDSNGGMDAFGGKDIFGSFDPSNMNENFFANAEAVGSTACSTETAGSVAYGTETAGSVAYGTETAGSVAYGAETAGSVACASDAGSVSCDSGSFCSVG